MKNCLYCLIDEEPLYKVYKWDKPKEFNWYCYEHLSQAINQEHNEKDQFLNYYNSEFRRKWLKPDQLTLWEKLNKKQ